MWDKVCYKVVLDDGTELIAADDHMWAVTTHVDATRKGGRLRVMTTQEMLTSGLYVQQGKKPAISKFRIPVAKPLLGEHKELSIHPYVLGYWLGDGTRADNTITTGDEEVVDYIRSLGCEIHKSYENSLISYRLNIRQELKQLELFGQHIEKHIPELYLQASLDQRLELLRGLMDSDGTIEDNGVVYFCNTEESLVKDVAFLLRSLGYKHSKGFVRPCETTKKASNYSENLYEKEWRLHFVPRIGESPFHLERKKARLKTERNSRNDWYFIKAIEPFSTVPMKCIKVDSPSHLFLAGRELIPTHNSDALLMAALQYVDIPDYSAILFRKSYADLTLPGALMDRAASWLGPYLDRGTVKWNDKLKTYTFFTEAQASTNSRRKNIALTSSLSFGFLDTVNDKYKYQGAEFQFAGVDEITQIVEHNYRYLFSRLRRLKGVPIPIRMRSASNPGGEGHEWVKRRMITEGRVKGRIFIPAKLDDNPFLDMAEYEESLNELDIVTREQLRHGDWEVKTDGSLFDRTWFEIVPNAPAYLRRVRFWDLAGSEVKKGKDPDWTVGLLLGEWKGLYFILDIKRFRRTPSDVENLIRQTAILDGKSVPIFMEQEPGQSGVAQIEHYARTILKGYNFKGNRASGSKVIRANPASSAAQQGRIKILAGGNWISDFLDEIESFPGGRHDDQVDALSGAFENIGNTTQAFMPLALDNEEGSYWTDTEFYSA